MPRLDGIDIAHYQYDQGPVDLATTATIPAFWFAAKATQSTSYKDPTFATSRAHAAPAGFTHVGGYHWLSSITDPGSQAAHFLATIGALHPGEFAMLDAEESGITANGALTWCEHVENVTRRPVVVYSGLYVSGGTIWRSIPLRTSQYGPRPFIVAAYVSAANLATRMRSTGSFPNFPYHAWQYSSNGPVAGIVGRCDMDMIVDRAAMDLAAGITQEASNMADTYFSVEGLPGEYLVRGSCDPVPFASAADRDALVAGMQLKPAGTISKAMYDRLFAPPAAPGPPGPAGATGPAGAPGADASGEVVGTFHGQVT